MQKQINMYAIEGSSGRIRALINHVTEQKEPIVNQNIRKEKVATKIHHYRKKKQRVTIYTKFGETSYIYALLLRA